MRPLVLFLSILLLSGVSRGDNSFVLATNIDMPPFLSDKVLNGGLHTDIVLSAFHAVDMKPEIRIMPWKRIYRAVEAGTVPATFSWVYSAERADSFLLSDEIIKTDDSILTTFAGLETLQDVAKYRPDGRPPIMCVPLGWSIHPTLERMRAENKLNYANPANVRSCVELMIVGRAHILYVPKLTVLYYMSLLKAEMAKTNYEWPDLYEIKSWDGHSSSIHVMFSKSERGEFLRSRFNEGLKQIKDSGAYEKIVTRHTRSYGLFQDSGSQAQAPKATISK